MPEPVASVTPAGGEGGAPATPVVGAVATPTSDGKGGQESIELAKKVGELEKVAKEYETYRQKVDPVLETLWTDAELLKKTQDAHNKRLGIKVDAPTTPATPVPGQPATPAASVQDGDTRNAVINTISNDFEKEVGISGLPADKQQEMRGMVGQMLKEMVDPKGNKSIPQVFEEISLTKLPWYLRQAYKLINRDSDVSKAKEDGKNEVLQQYGDQNGIIGSIPGGSAALDTIVLTPAEKKAAENMGIPEEKYLKNKKEILAMRG